MGSSLVDNFIDVEAIVSALTADSLEQVRHPAGRQFRIFADHNKADRAALAACMASFRRTMTPADVRRIATPALVAVGETDESAGDPQALAEMLPHGEAFVIPRRDHMRATGDKAFKAAVLDFLSRHQNAQS
jgi:pimeloyl-ACP methyl ester carboxylesterase